MKKLEWFERKFSFGLPGGMLPFYLERLQGTIARIESKVKDVSEEILSYPLDNKWSVKQNIGHLAEVDEIAIRRIDTDLTKASLHPGLKTNMTPVDLAWFDAEHDDHHLI